MSDELRRSRMLDHALRLIHGGHDDQAIDVLTRLLGEAPDDADAHAALALCLVSRHRLHAAKLEAAQALALEPDAVLGHLAMASVSIARREFPAAEAHIDAARALAPEEPQSYRLAASLYRNWGRDARALEEIAKAHALAPDDPATLAQYGLLLFQDGRRDEARRFAERALERDPEHVEALTLLGHCDLAAGRVEDARAHAVWALQNEPGDVGALTLLSAIKARRSWLLGLWWRFQTWVTAGTNRRAIALLVGLYLVYRIADVALREQGLEDGAAWLSFAWLGFCVYTWFAPSIFLRSLRREFETVRLRPDY
ncbi:MAG: tetratricopeptide repeat protein [Xanthomonadales bacterium]|nr:tetratricopeptide repeat protein [Xanthomonadales bacterium]